MNNSIYTARSNQDISKSAKLLVFKTEPQLVLDYGCGFLRNSRYLKKQGYEVEVYDIPEQLKRINSEFPISDFNKFYGVVLCSFVLNVVELSERKEILKSISKCTNHAFIEVRRSIQAKYKNPFKDGFLVGKNRKTFQKGFTEKELFDLVNKEGFTVVNVIKTNSLIMEIKY